MKKVSYIVLLISALVLAGCEMAFPDVGATPTVDFVTATAVSPDATPLPDGSGSTDPNAGGGGPNVPPATDVPTTEPTKTAVLPTATVIPPTETAVPPTIAPTPTTEPTPVPPPTAVPPTTEPQRTHTVAPGENLYRISLQYGLTWPQIAAANGITDPDSIYLGQVLIIPAE